MVIVGIASVVLLLVFDAISKPSGAEYWRAANNTTAPPDPLWVTEPIAAAGLLAVVVGLVAGIAYTSNSTEDDTE
jgi:hypothetical protein